MALLPDQETFPDSQAVAKALEGLTSDEPARRVEARQQLLAQGAEALPAITAALDQIHSPADPLYQELIRICDWIHYGVDPRRLTGWFQELDLRTLEHGNMFGGMEGAILDQPAFARIVEQGGRIRPFLESTVSDAQEPYSLRATAALLVRKLHLVPAVPALIAAFREEHRLLSAEAAEQVRLEQPYRGFFLHALHLALEDLTGERFPHGVFQHLSGLYATGLPAELYIPPVGEEALRRWQLWSTLAESGGGEATEGPGQILDGSQVGRLLARLDGASDDDGEEARAAVRFALHRLGSEAETGIIDLLRTQPQVTRGALDLAEMLLLDGRMSLLGEGERTAELLAGVLGRARNPLVLRHALRLATAAAPVSLLRALPTVVEHHPLAEQGHLHLFNPWTFLGWGGMPPPAEISGELLDVIVAGLSAEAPRPRELFSDLIATLRPEKDEEKAVVLERLRRAAGHSESLSDRVTWLELLHRLGEPPDLPLVLNLASRALAEGEPSALGSLLELLSSLQVPAESREPALELLFRAAEAHPDLHVSVLRALSQVDKESFSFNPVLGPPGVRALIDLYRLGSSPVEEPERARIAEAVRQIRNDLMPHLGDGTFQSIFVSHGLDVCIEAADRFELPEVLFDSLMAKVVTLAVSEPVMQQRESAPQAPRRFLAESQYLESLGEVTWLSSHDTAAAAAGSAAEVALRHGLPESQVFQALTSQADMARIARRFEQAEALFHGLEAYVQDDPERARSQKHFLALLLLEQRRWADALDVALALPVPPGDPAGWTPEQRHLVLDARLHEAFCRHRLGQVNRSIEILQDLSPGYIEIQHLQHYVQVLIEAATIQAELGEVGVAEELFQAIRQLLQDRPDQGLTLAQALSAEADWRMRTGQAEAAEALLTEAIALQEAGDHRRFEGFDTRSETLWRLGQAQLAQGKTAAASEPLAHLQNRAGREPLAAIQNRVGREPVDPLAHAYAVRLQAALQVFEGAIPSAILTLRESLTLLERGIYPELKIDLCLDLHRLLLSKGFVREAAEALDRALPVAMAARDPVQVGRIQLARARALEQAGDLAAARAIYAEIMDRPPEDQDRGDAWFASVLALALLDAEDGVPLPPDSTESILLHIGQIHDARLRLDLLCRYARFCLSHRLFDGLAPVMERIDAEIQAGVPLDALLEVVLLRGRAADLSGQPEEATRRYREAVHLVEVIHATSLEAGGLGSGFFTSIEAPYRALVRNLVAANDPREALHFVERAKARLFLEQIHWQESSGQTQSASLQSYLRALRRLAVLEAGPGTASAPDEVQTLRRELAELKDGIADQDLAAVLFPILGAAQETWDDLTDLLGEGADTP